MTKNKQSTRQRLKTGNQVFTLDVYIISGPIAEKFAKRNKVICRTIQIRGDQTLEDLHHVLFDAFDREDEHMYEFQVGGKGPMDPNARRYVLPMAANDPVDDSKPAGTVRATIGSLGLKKDDVFGYWFDFGDDWWHQIEVMGIEETTKRTGYPKVTNRVGASPPQYIDWDEEDDQ